MGEQYKLAVFRDLEFWSRDFSIRYAQSKWPKLKTIYFGWWTPLLLWSQYLIDILQEVESNFDVSELQELTIECNPYPYQETLESVKHIIQTYSHIPRLRFSFGIQSLDNNILQQSNRDCTFAGIQQFTYDIMDIKQSNVLYNYDFISFGETLSAQWQMQHKRLQELIKSKQIDSFSLYTLELFAWAKRYHETKDPLIAYQAPWDHEVPFTTSEDSILDQFEILKKLFVDGGYSRYEISNYALPGKECIHNQTYRTMGEYIGIGLGAHGFIKWQNDGMTEWQSYRTETTWWRKNYILWPTEKTFTKKPCSPKDIMIETFFLWLRQQSGIGGVSKYSDILQNNRQQAIDKLIENELATYNNDTLQLTDQWMNVHHQVCTYLMKEI